MSNGFKLGDLSRFVHEHLTAAAVMVELERPLSPSMRALGARRYLEENDFDLALVDDDRLQILVRRRLQGLNREHLQRPISEFAEAPKRERLIEGTLPIRDVVRKLASDPEPLLVVGHEGTTHVVTRADFAGVAGTAIVLSYLVALDRGLNELLRPRSEEALALLDEDKRTEAEERRERAAAEGSALDTIDYLGMGSRLLLVRKLGLHKQFSLGTRDDHELLRKTRNDAAHRVLSDPEAALQAIEKAEELLTTLASLDSREKEEGNEPAT